MECSQYIILVVVFYCMLPDILERLKINDIRVYKLLRIIVYISAFILIFISNPVITFFACISFAIFLGLNKIYCAIVVVLCFLVQIHF